jgi:hypothetical protein
MTTLKNIKGEIIKILNQIFAPRVTSYTWINGKKTDEVPYGVSEAFKKMNEAFEKMNEAFGKIKV